MAENIAKNAEVLQEKWSTIKYEEKIVSKISVNSKTIFSCLFLEFSVQFLEGFMTQNFQILGTLLINISTPNRFKYFIVCYTV